MLVAYDLWPAAGDPNIRAGHIRGFIRQQPDNSLGNFHRLTQSAHGYFPQHIEIGRRDHIGLGHAGSHIVHPHPFARNFWDSGVDSGVAYTARLT